jgi:UMF1 family MFS transporter
MASKSPAPFLERIALHRPELRAWAMYDWANSAMVTTIIGAVFPFYFSKVAAAGLPPAIATQRFALATTASLVFVAVASPLLGALADTAGIKKKLLALFMGLGLVTTGLMFFIHRGDWRLATALFVLANIGVAGSFVFYDALLPHVARRDEMDRLSTTGYALRYLGGGLLLALNLAWIQKPAWFGLPQVRASRSAVHAPARLSLSPSRVWWLVFAIRSSGRSRAAPDVRRARVAARSWPRPS